MMKLVFLLVIQCASAVEVYVGAGSVVLPCSVNRSDLDNLTVVWRREDLRPPTVHSKEQGNDRLGSQNQQYRHRTSVRDPQQERGVASLTLIKPLINDNGTYTCIIRRRGEDLSRTDVPLLVKEPFLHVASFLLGIVLGGLLILASVAWCWRRKRMIGAVCQVKVNKVVCFIKLPCQTAAELLEGDTVEWILSDPKPKVVHRFVIGRNQPENQHESYHKRTEMTDRLRTGDLTLTLNDPCCEDSGIYICTVRRDRGILAQNVVELQVQAER